MKRKRKSKCIPGLGAARSSHLRKRVRDERRLAAYEFVAEYEFQSACAQFRNPSMLQSYRSRYNRARALAAECGV